MTNVLMIAPLNAANFESGNAPDTHALFANGEGGSEWRAPAGGAPAYKVYVALLTQTGENAPVATVLENTLGDEVVWTREDAGMYLGTVTGGFPLQKTAVLTPLILTSEGLPNGVYGSCAAGGNLNVSTFTLSPNFTPVDDQLFYSGVIVHIYP